MSHPVEGIRITNRVDTFADHLRSGQSGFLPFGDETMYSWHAIPVSLLYDGKDGLFVMFGKKNRPREKPCVLTPNRERARELVGREDIFDPSVTDIAKERIFRLFAITPVQSSLGILCTGKRELRSEILHQTKKTVGIMIPGVSSQYDEVVNKIDKLFTGTSSNPSGLPRSRGSGADKLIALLVDFGHDPDLCVLLARGREPSGGSSSMLELSADGNKATIIRTGNLSLGTMVEMCHNVGINEIETTQIKQILPYDRSGFPGGNTFAWGIFQYYRLLTKLKGDVRAPLWSVEQLRNRVV